MDRFASISLARSCSFLRGTLSYYIHEAHLGTETWYLKRRGEGQRNLWRLNPGHHQTLPVEADKRSGLQLRKRIRSSLATVSRCYHNPHTLSCPSAQRPSFYASSSSILPLLAVSPKAVPVPQATIASTHLHTSSSRTATTKRSAPPFPTGHVSRSSAAETNFRSGTVRRRSSRPYVEPKHSVRTKAAVARR